MTLDELAAMAMQGMMSHSDVDVTKVISEKENGREFGCSGMVGVAYDIAEAMQAESRKRAESRPLKNTVESEMEYG